jgi:hypothetical protein
VRDEATHSIEPLQENVASEHLAILSAVARQVEATTVETV